MEMCSYLVLGGYLEQGEKISMQLIGQLGEFFSFKVSPNTCRETYANSDAPYCATVPPCQRGTLHLQNKPFNVLEDLGVCGDLSKETMTLMVRSHQTKANATSLSLSLEWLCNPVK